MSNTIGQICSRFSSGDTITTKSIQTKGKYPVYGGNGLRGYTDSYNFDGECAIIGRQGAKCGNVRYFKGKAFMTEHAIIAVANKDNSSGYLSYKLQQMNLNRYQGQSAQPGLSVKTLSDVPISMPPLKVQENIFDILNTISIKIENNNKIISELECMAKTIYDYWFLQFEFPNENGKPYKSSGGKMVWNEELKREIPEGWKVEPLFQCMDVTYGYPLSTNFFNQEEGTPVIRIRDILDNSTSAYTTEKIPDKYISKSKDLLVGMDGNFHMNYCCEDGQYINQRIVRIREKDNISTMQVCFEIAPYIKKKEQNVARSTVGHLSDKDLKSIYILNSNNSHVYKVFNDFLEKICTARKENKKLTALRDFLLPMLMNGQVTIKEKA